MNKKSESINALALSYVVDGGGGALLRFNRTSKYYRLRGISLHQMGVIDRDGSLEKASSPFHRLYQILRSTIFLTRRGFKHASHSKVDLIITPIGEMARCLFSAFMIHLAKGIPWVVIVQGSVGGYFGNSYSEIYRLYRGAGYSILQAIAMEMHCIVSRSLGRPMLQFSSAIIAVEDGLIPARVNVPIFIIPNTYVPKSPPQLEEIRQKNLDAVFLGRVKPEKGIFDLLNAWKIVTRHVSDARLGIIGPVDKGMESNIRERLKMLGLEDGVTLFGGRYDQEKDSIMKKSKLFVLPSRTESFGFVAYEALNYGLPVVCYDIEPLKGNLGDCEAVIYAEYGNVRDLAYKIIKILKNRVLFERLSHQAIEFLLGLDFRSWSDIAEEERRVYRSVLYEFS